MSRVEPSEFFLSCWLERTMDQCHERPSNFFFFFGGACLEMKYNRHLIIAICFYPLIYILFYHLLIFPPPWN